MSRKNRWDNSPSETTSELYHNSDRRAKSDKELLHNFSGKHMICYVPTVGFKKS